MASVRQRDEDMSRMQRPREWPVRNESLRAVPRPVIGLPARPDSALSQRRPSETDSRGSSSKSALGRSYSAGAPEANQRDIRHIPKLSISSENGEPIDITNVDMRHGVHQSQHSTMQNDKHGGASNVTRRDEAVVDMAMEIAEEISLMCATPRPVDTDEPFVTVGLNADGARRLEGWLYARFDSYSPAARLMDKNITAETLAVEIIARTTLSSHSSGGHDTRPGKLRTPPPATGSAVRVSEASLQENRLTPTPSKRLKGKPLSIKLEDDLYAKASNATLTPTTFDTSIGRSPSPSPYSGMIPIRRDGQKSGGLMLGILTVGAILGSPLTTNFDQPGSGSMLAFPASSTLSPYYAYSSQASARTAGARLDHIYVSPPAVSPRRETPLPSMLPRSPLVAI